MTTEMYTRSLCSLTAASRYSTLGWPVLPMRPSSKIPYVTWKEHRSHEGSFETAQILTWFQQQFPDAGIAVLLGPPSGVVAIDVDGQKPYEELMNRIGTVPMTPTIKSGNPDPHRLQFLFRLPINFETKATISPLIKGLEFRGDGGLTILPPSIHPSGNLYAWLPGRSPEEVPLAELPLVINRAWLAAIQARAARAVSHPTYSPQALDEPHPDSFHTAGPSVFGRCTRATQQFLLGLYRNGPGWNQRLFNAACDMAGNGVPREISTEYLLAGAQPWTDEETTKALATIESAYSQPRHAAREWSLQQRLTSFGRGPRK